MNAFWCTVVCGLGIWTVVLTFLDALFIYRLHIYPDHTSAEKVIYAFIYRS